MYLAASIGILALVVILPLAPGFWEIMRPVDNERLSLRAEYARDPRFFGNSFREKLKPFLEMPAEKLPFRGEFLTRVRETVLVDKKITVQGGHRTGEMLVSQGDLDCGTRSRATDCYAKHSLITGDDVHARALISDGTMTIGSRTVVDRWLDAEVRLEVGPHCRLGQSVSCAGPLNIGQGSRFSRAFGLPFLGVSVASTRPRHVDIEKTVMFARRRLSIPDNTILDQDVVVHGSLTIGRNCVIRGSVKTYRPVEIGDGTVIQGNVISRSSVLVGRDVRIAGHIFAEGDVDFGDNATVGTIDTHKSIYTTGALRVRNGARVFGWAISEAGGVVV